MSIYTTFGNWWYGKRRPEEVASTPVTTGKPDITADSGRQDVGIPNLIGLPCPNGNNRNNPCGFPGYGSLYLGDYPVYRFMRRHPRIAQVRAQVFNSILAGDWSFEVRKGTPEAQADLIKDMLGPQRLCTVKDTLYGLDYGWVGFEKVWEVKEGRYWMTYSKPLSVDRTNIMVEKDTGEFVGIRYAPGENGWLDRLKCWKWTYGGEAGEHYGQSRLENIRETAWRDWLDAATDLWRLSTKVSGILPILMTPAGSFKDSSGATHTWSDTGRQIIQALVAGQGAHIQSLALSGTTVNERAIITDQNIALAKASLVSLDVKDFGNQAPAIEGILKRMEHNEDLMFAGYHRSSRTGMQSKSGSRADSEQHTDTDTTDCELIDALIAEAFNIGVVDDVLVLNFGESARGAVKVKAAKLRDAHRELDQLVIEKGILVDPALRMQFVTQLDNDAIVDRRGLPTKDGEPMVLEKVEPAPVPGNVPPQPGQPGQPPPIPPTPKEQP